MSVEIGIESFSYHRYFGETTPWETPLDARWSILDFLDRAYEIGVGAVSVQSIHCDFTDLSDAAAFRTELDARRLESVLAWGHRSGLEDGLNPNRVTDAHRAIRHAELMGCSMMRIVCGDQFSWSVPPAIRTRRLTPILKQLAARAQASGITLAVENHADFRMADLVDLIQKADMPNLGICFDTGNSIRAGDNILEAAELAAPLTRMVHLKDMKLIPASKGDPTAWWPSTPLGKGEINIPVVTQILSQRGYNGALFVEMANMAPDWPDEDDAVVESVRYLRVLLGRCVN